MIEKWKRLRSSIALGERWFKVRKDEVELPSGKILPDYFVWESGDVSMTVPITEDGKLLLVRQYKHGIGEMMIEFPAGYLNQNNKETAQQAAERELVEETGVEIEKIEQIGKVVHHPTKETGVLNLFLARVKRSNIKIAGDENEEIEILEMTPEEVLEKILNGEIWATATIAAFFLAKEKSNNFVW